MTSLLNWLAAAGAIVGAGVLAAFFFWRGGED
jgi:hypothetical protein